jgi:PilZ domain
MLLLQRKSKKGLSFDAHTGFLAALRFSTAGHDFFEKVPLTWLFPGTTFRMCPAPPVRNLSAERFTVAITPLSQGSLEDRWARMRSHKRIISRVKFLVEWDDDKQKQRANAVTVDVSHSGCMAIVGAPLPLHKQVRLIHPETGRKAEAQVVWRDHEAWDTGFELAKPDASFWGVPF